MAGPARFPRLVFTTPRKLPDPRTLEGRVVVLDVAFAAEGMGTPFGVVTQPFLDGLGDRLALWVDHHDHEQHARFKDDPRFVLRTKAQHGACPEMITPEMVRQTGPIDTIVAHLDLDGLFATAKWIRGGTEPYAGADADARAVDTRIGVPSARGTLVDHALRARFRDETLKMRVVRWLVGGAHDKDLAAELEQAAAEFRPLVEGARRLAEGFQVKGHVAMVDARDGGPYDKTELLLLGQMRAPVAVVRDSGMITLAADFDSGWNFVELLRLGGGMPTRVSLPDSRLGETLDALHAAPLPTPRVGECP